MRKNITDETKQAISTDYSNGLKFRELKEKYDLSYPTLRKHLVAQGTTIRGRGRPKKQA